MLGYRFAFVGVVLAATCPAAAEPLAPTYTLSQLKAMAAGAHPTLDSADAATRVAEGLLRQARAFVNPELEFESGRGRPREGGGSRSEAFLELRQSIEMPGLRRWRVRVAELGVRGAEIERTQVTAVVDATVARLAYGVLLEQRRAEIARQSSELARRLLDLLTRRVELGESAPLVAVKARSEWFARRRDVLDAEAGLEAARSALDLFCGGLGGGWEIAETLKAPAGDLPVDLVERLRSRNPILQRVAVAIEEAEARTEVVRRERLPGVELSAGHETELDRTATSVGVGLILPLWSRQGGAIQAAVAERERVLALQRALASELETELARAVAEYRRAEAVSRLHLEGWTAAASRALDIATFSFENGEASLLDVLDSQRSYLEVARAEAESGAALALARVEIERLIDGPLGVEASDEGR